MAKDESQKQKIKQLEVKIKKHFSRYSKTERTTTKQAINLGKQLLKLKRLTKKKNKWTQYATEQFPYIETRTRQRFMNLARYINLDTHENLALLSQTKLEELIKLSVKTSVGEYLETNLPEGLDFDDGNAEEVLIFKEEVCGLIRQKKGEGNAKEKGNKSQSNKAYKAIIVLDSWLEDRIDQKASVPANVVKKLKKHKKLIDALLAISQKSSKK